MKSLKYKLIPVLGLTGALFLTGCAEDFGQTLTNAGLNTLMGVVIVFLMLLFISLIISLFQFINKAEKAIADRKAKKEAKNNPAPVETPATPAMEEAEEDDLELIAVITAAIAMQEGTSPDGLIVRSIRKVSNANKWKRG